MAKYKISKAQPKKKKSRKVGSKYSKAGSKSFIPLLQLSLPFPILEA